MSDVTHIFIDVTSLKNNPQKNLVRMIDGNLQKFEQFHSHNFENTTIINQFADVDSYFFVQSIQQI